MSYLDGLKVIIVFNARRDFEPCKVYTSATRKTIRGYFRVPDEIHDGVVEVLDRFERECPDAKTPYLRTYFEEQDLVVEGRFTNSYIDQWFRAMEWLYLAFPEIYEFEEAEAA